MSGVVHLGIMKAKLYPRSEHAVYVYTQLILMSIYRYSPSNFVHKWSTPQLLIHGSKDYRLPETESIGAFHALQQLVLRGLFFIPDLRPFVDSVFQAACSYFQMKTTGY